MKKKRLNCLSILKKKHSRNYKNLLFNRVYEEHKWTSLKLLMCMYLDLEFFFIIQYNEQTTLKYNGCSRV